MPDTMSAAATGLPKFHDAGPSPQSTCYIAILASAVCALDDRLAGVAVPETLAPALRLARTVVAAKAAGVPVTEGELAEAAAALV